MASAAAAGAKMSRPWKVGDAASGATRVTISASASRNTGEKRPLSGPDEGMSSNQKRESRAAGADAGIDHGEMDGSGGISVPGPAEEVGARSDVTRWNGMRDVHEGCRGHRAQDHTLHLRDVRIGGAEVAQQCDERHGSPEGLPSEDRERHARPGGLLEQIFANGFGG